MRTETFTFKEFFTYTKRADSHMKDGLLHGILSVPLLALEPYGFAHSFAGKAEDYKKAYDNISILTDFMIHPTKLVLMLWNGLVSTSYWICLFVCIFSIVAYIFGFKKKAKYAPLAIFVYIFVMAVNSSL